MNRYDEFYLFRRATIDDINNVMNLIRDEWKATHIFAVDKDFFCYEHQNKERFNFVLAIDKETGEIAGLQGFIPYSEDEDGEWFASSGVIIKVKVPSKLPSLGIEIMKRVAELVPYKDYCAVGVNPKTCLPLTKRYMNRYIGRMQHFYRLNSDFLEYHIAQISSLMIEPTIGPGSNSLKTVHNIDESNYNFLEHYDNLPFKDKWYINKRYFNHPIYHYRIMEVINTEHQVEGLLIGREIQIEDRKIFRLVDFIGNTKSIASIGGCLDALMKENNYEYVDFMLEGLEEDILRQAGFVLNKDDSGNIIPNYFEPYVPENIAIWFEKSRENMVLFKADGDQDRPNYR